MPFEPEEHDAKLWIPFDARARIEKDQAAPTNVVIDNRTDLPDDALESYFIENTAMFGFGRDVRYQSYAAEGTMMARSKWQPPRNVIEEIEIARELAERDDDVRATIGTMLAAAYSGGYQNQHEDEQIEHTFAEMSEDIGLSHVLHECHRELLISGQINTVTLFTRQQYDIRPENVSRLIRRSVAAPMIGVLPAERVRVMGNDLFGDGPLAYLPEGRLAMWLREFFANHTTPARKREMRLQDPVAAALFIGEAPLAPFATDLLSTVGQSLYLLNPTMVHRSTFPRGTWKYPRPLLTSDLSLLEAKRLLNVMDHALLQGGINYIVVAKKGDEKKPATQPEIANLQGLVQRASRSGVLIGDHRINLEIIQPDLTEMLNPEKRRMIGRKLSQAMLRVPEFGSDDTGAAVQTFTELVQAVITDDRSLVIGHVHRYIWREAMKRNASTFGRTDRPLIWTPRVILQGLDFWTQYLLKLYDRGDLPRKYMVEFGGYDYDAVKAQKQREVENDHDSIFAPPPVPFSSPNQGPGDPYQYGNPSRTPASPGSGAPGPNDNGGGRPPGARTGQPRDSARPTRVVRRTPGETVRAAWNEEEQAVVRIGEITEQVLAEYPDAQIGRVTPAERSALDAGHTVNAGNVIVVPVNQGYRVDEEIRAVRLGEDFSMIVGYRQPDGAMIARAFCFREPRFEMHEAEDKVIRWGYPVAIEDEETYAVGGVEPGKYVYLKCPECGLVQDAAHDHCTRCGHDLTEARKGMFAQLTERGQKPTLHSQPPPPASQQPDLRKPNK